MKRDMAADNLSIDEFAQLVENSDPAAFDVLRRILEHVSSGGELFVRDAESPEDYDPRPRYIRLANAIFALLDDPDSTLTPEHLDTLAYHNRHLTSIFQMAWPRGAERVFRHIADAHGGMTDSARLARMLAVSSIVGSNGLNWEKLLELHPEIAFPLFLANFTHSTLLDPEAEAYRDALFALAPLLDDIPLRTNALWVLAEAWMLCSYATAPDRHRLKRHLNAMIGGLLQRNDFHSLAPPKTRVLKDRPTLVVVADVLRSSHVIYRTYVHFLRQIATRFRLVLITLKGGVDDTSAAHFEDVFTFEQSDGLLESVASKLKEITPDIIYYPSVGMTLTTVLLSNLRLASIQIASVGHPATTHSPAMDYMVMGHEYLDEAAEYSEQVMLLQSGGALFTPSPNSPPTEALIRENPDPIRIAVPSSPMKLNSAFLSLCSRVAEESERPVEFCFFPNQTGHPFEYSRREITARLDGAVVTPRLDFTDYNDQLRQSDIYFGSYPFGGANAAVDTFLHGLAPVVMEGTEPHSRTDKRFIHLFGLPKWLIARNEEEYEAAALRLINDDGERCAISRHILDADPAAVIYYKEQNLYPTDFGDLVWWLYRNHERIKASDRRTWSFEDRQAFDAG